MNFYDLKVSQEAIWALIVGVATAVYEVVQAQGAGVPDWRALGVALVAALARPVAAFLWNLLLAAKPAVKGGAS